MRILRQKWFNEELSSKENDNTARRIAGVGIAGLGLAGGAAAHQIGFNRAKTDVRNAVHEINKAGGVGPGDMIGGGNYARKIGFSTKADGLSNVGKSGKELGGIIMKNGIDPVISFKGIGGPNTEVVNKINTAAKKGVNITRYGVLAGGALALGGSALALSKPKKKDNN